MNNRKRKIGIVRDPVYLNHLTGEGHPESPKRLERIYSMLDHSDFLKRLIHIIPREAKDEELIPVHTPEYLLKLSTLTKKKYSALSPDTPTSSGSCRAAYFAAGGMFEAVKRVVEGELSSAFVLSRPPGHHAEKSRALGYCLLNNVALGAVYAQKAFGLDRILIVDWDLHHGNGTQHIFENDSSVLFFSIHQYPLFPGTGLFTESGRSPGEGYTVNIPIAKNFGNAEYLMLFKKMLYPIAMEFKPQLILVSAGFDTHIKDPLGGMRMTSKGFAGLTQSLMILARYCCEGKLVFTLEGGYHVDSLSESVMAVLQELLGITTCDFSALSKPVNQKKVNYAIQCGLHVHKQFWKSLKND